MRPEAIRVLLVEDSPGYAGLVMSALDETSGMHFEVTPADRLSQALAALQAEVFDAVLLDLSLPDSWGLQTVNAVRDAAPSLPIVVLSGSSDDSAALEAVKSGAQDYLVKGQVDGHLAARAICYAMERKRTEVAWRRSSEQMERWAEERTAHLEAANRQLELEIAGRRHTEAVLRREHDFIITVLNTVGALVVVLDMEGRILRFNRAGEELTGYRFDEIKWCYVWDHFILDTDVAATKALFESLRADRIPRHQQGYWLTRSGEYGLIDWSTTVLADRQSAIEYVIATGIDITERKRAEEQERQRLLETAHISRLSIMGEMATEIAHEINQPLTAIASYADIGLRLLQAPQGQQDELSDALREIAGQAHRAAEFVRRVRGFVRKDTGYWGVACVNELVRAVVQLTAVEARQHGVTVSLDLTTSLPRPVVDRILIEQVILNLVRNAIEAMGESPERHLDIRTRQRENQLEVAVIDTGPGVDEAVYRHVFEPFYTTKAEGMGMGLAISRSIIEAHRGRLWMEEVDGRGISFHFSLPIPEQEAG